GVLLERPGDAEQEVLLVVRLRDQVVGALPDEVQPALDGTERGQQDHRRRGMQGQQLLEERLPVQARHLHVGHDEVEGLLLGEGDRRVAGLCGRHFTAVPSEQRSGELQNLGLVVDEEDALALDYRGAFHPTTTSFTFRRASSLRLTSSRSPWISARCAESASFSVSFSFKAACSLTLSASLSARYLSLSCARAAASVRRVSVDRLESSISSVSASRIPASS